MSISIDVFLADFVNVNSALALRQMRLKR